MSRGRWLRLEIQKLREGSNELDGVPEQWEMHRGEQGEVTPLAGREYEQAQQMQSNTTHKIRTHWFAGANSSMRLKHKDRIFNVESVINEHERNGWLLWRVVEVT